MDKETQPFMTEGFKAFLLQDTGIGTSELAARTCYNSFSKSEHPEIEVIGNMLSNNSSQELYDDIHREQLQDIETSNLLDSLAWTHFHYSILEHSVLTYSLTMSRGVLIELTRHRLASPSVKSTRYTMKNIIDAYVASEDNQDVGSRQWFINKVRTFKMFCVKKSMEQAEIESIYDKLKTSELPHGRVSDLCLHKEAKACLSDNEFSSSDEMFEALQKCKTKRNAGDPIKFIVTDMWLTEAVWTINLRSLKNFLDLRNSGAAWKPMQHLAQLIEQATPTKQLRLISKKYKRLNDAIER